MKASRVLRLSFASLVLAGSLASHAATLAWLTDGQVQTRTLSSAPQPETVPLGSLWKLYAYAYLVETQASEHAYTCPARPMKAGDENLHCCAPGETVGRDLALARSCSPYFSPQRLGISATDWRTFWQRHAMPDWLGDLGRMQPATTIPLPELLHSLRAFSPAMREAARTALLHAAVEGNGREAWPALGTGIRYKTYSWHDATGRALGGAAGWLVDGTPFWFGATGSSRSALGQWAGQIASALPETRADALPQESTCVDVDFFARYPLRAVWRGKEAARAGRMTGTYRLEFANGNNLTIHPRGDLFLQTGDSPTITGRFGLNEYIARVIAREGDTAMPQAASALAIAARTYLTQNAAYAGGCWRIDDSTRSQRVSPNPPDRTALAAAWFTDALVLDGVPVQYHRDSAGENRLSWQDARVQAQAGWHFEHILRAAYPRASLIALDGSRECRRLTAAETWLNAMTARWQKQLAREPGFELLKTPPQICSLRAGQPYADQRRLRIHARGWRTLDERITLAHEYLHLVFRFHPNGADEEYIERLARRLIEG